MVKFPLTPGVLVATGVHWLNGRRRFLLVST
jgi:hypothetical protein